MKYLSNLVVVLCVSLLCACASNQNKQATNPLRNLTGIYSGNVVSGGGTIPVKTEFFTDKQGRVAGRYEMTETGGKVTPGTLDHFEQEGPYTLLAQWHDKYGNGYLRMMFSEPKYVFKGFWGLSKDGTLMNWDGYKQ